MKKLFVTAIALLFVLFFSSCEREEIAITSDTQTVSSRSFIKNSEKRALLSEAEINKQKEIYFTLSSAEKAEVWRTKFEVVLNTDLTLEQRLLVNELYQNVTPEVFDSPEGVRNFYNNFLTEWAQKAKKHFTKREMFEYFAHLGKIGKYKASLINARASCTCSRTIDFCGDLDCRIPSGGCIDSAHGCGLMWIMSCTGTCQFS